MVFIPTVVYILTVVSSLCDYSSQHSPHSLAISFHVIFVSAYPAVQVKLAYVNMPGRNDWASEASPTLGCSIEISRDIYVYIIYIYVGMSRMSN